MRVLSLAKVSVSIENSELGKLSFGANKSISISGGGNSLGSIGYAYENEIFKITSTADGGAAASHNASKAATVTIAIKPTSPVIKELNDFIRWCWVNPTQAASKLTIIDETGNICATAYNILPKKIPDNTVNEEIGERSFDFITPDLETTD